MCECTKTKSKVNTFSLVLLLVRAKLLVLVLVLVLVVKEDSFSFTFSFSLPKLKYFTKSTFVLVLIYQNNTTVWLYLLSLLVTHCSNTGWTLHLIKLIQST